MHNPDYVQIHHVLQIGKVIIIQIYIGYKTYTFETGMYSENRLCVINNIDYPKDTVREICMTGADVYNAGHIGYCAIYIVDEGLQVRIIPSVENDSHVIINASYITGD